MSNCSTEERLLEYGGGMTQKFPAGLNQPPYELHSVAKTSPPHGSEGVWHKYVIAQGTSLIVGVRSGTAAEVDCIVRDMIERLNERRMGKTRPRTKPAPATS